MPILGVLVAVVQTFRRFLKEHRPFTLLLLAIFAIIAQDTVTAGVEHDLAQKFPAYQKVQTKYNEVKLSLYQGFKWTFITTARVTERVLLDFGEVIMNVEQQVPGIPAVVIDDEQFRRRRLSGDSFSLSF